MDVSKYVQSRDSGNVEVKRYGDSFQCVKRQFDPETGSETTPSIATFTEAELLKQKETVSATLANINEMLADIQALKA